MDTTLPTFKECPHCRQQLPLGEFHRRRRSVFDKGERSTARHSWCRRCTNEAVRLWRQRRTAEALATPVELFGLPIQSLPALLGIAPPQAAKSLRRSESSQPATATSRKLKRRQNFEGNREVANIRTIKLALNKLRARHRNGERVELKFARSNSMTKLPVSTLWCIG